MNRFGIYLKSMAILISVVVCDKSKMTETHYCEALEANDNRIDYFLSYPAFDGINFQNQIVIRGLVWYPDYNGTALPKGQKTDSGSIDGRKGFVKLYKEYGQKWSMGYFFEQTYKCGFGVRYPMNKIEKVIIGGVTEDYEYIIYWIGVEGKKDGLRLRRDGNDTNERSKSMTTKEPWIWSLKTGFNEIQFQPQVSFNTFANIERNIVYFIETKPGSEKGTNQNIIKSFSIPDPNIKKEITETFGDVNKMPESIVEVSNRYRIVGVLPMKFEKSKTSKTGFIFVIDFCDSEDVPCTGTLSYQYCIVETQDSGVTDEGKPCHKSGLRPLYDCTNWDSRKENYENTDPITADTNSTTTEIPTVMTEETMTEETMTEETMASSSTQTTIDRTTSRSQPEESGFPWLWILLLIILIIAIILILICILCCRKSKKSDSPVKAVPISDKEGVGNTMSSLSTASTRSGVDGQTGKSGLGAPSTLSTASNRSGVDGQHQKTGLDAASSLSTTSTRSGVNKPDPSSSIGQGADIPSTVSSASTRSGVNNN